MNSEIDHLFDQYCTVTPFPERCLTSWQLFAARATRAPLTFHQHNNAALRELYTLVKQELLAQKQRADILEVGANHSFSAVLVL
jgi:hypothetical protein